MLAKSMDFKAIFGEVCNVLFNKFKLNSQRCRAFMFDGCAANLKAILVLTTHCANNAVGIRCMSHLFNNAGDQVESKQIDNFAGALQTVLSHSANAPEQWRSATNTAPPKVPSHRWASKFERSDQFVTVWQPIEKFIDVYSTSDEARSAKAKLCGEELARMGKDGYHQQFWLQLEFALAVDLGFHLMRATYLLGGNGMLVSYCVFSFRRPVPPFFRFCDHGLCFFIYFYNRFRAYFPGFPLYIFASSFVSATLGV